MPTQTIFVVDDDRDFRDSLVALLSTLGWKAQGFSSAEEFIEFYAAQPGCLILDIQMDGLNGIELYEQLLTQGKRLPVIFVTAHADINTAVSAMRTGAIDFLEKPFDRKALTRQIERALEIDEQWQRSEERFQQLNESVKELNPKDWETLELIIEGETNKSMAAKLHLTERAVELRRQRLMKRLNVRSLAELLELTVAHRVLAEVRAINQSQWPRLK
ncbi:response regulator [Thalassoglobus sp. JC818]|uniref:response regulator transcription factor n=1 Tax=Thalassoglobus sp. JC818 TaxID=3232136 RepID=UPI00345872AF